MGAPQKADWREERRKQAWKLKEQGWQQKDIAVALGVSEGAVSHWMKRGREGGVEALKAHPPKGVSPRLTAEQKAQILAFVEQRTLTPGPPVRQRNRPAVPGASEGAI